MPQPDGVSWASSPTVRRVMQGNRDRDTRSELALRSAAWRLGLRYRVAFTPVPGLRRKADLVFTRARVAVFADGCYWHGCPDHGHVPRTNAAYWAAKLGRNRTRDAEADRRLSEAGWLVLRVWEHEDPAAAAQRLAILVSARRP
ncbi:MAG TPA: very short patch repair endonuclease [Verrucomicrobiae bacterium]|nr:very short patch repair endonuclease [Verrucomicrobiae bacterium]